jgi:O-antigen/teichoic acid export membrane protein
MNAIKRNLGWLLASQGATWGVSIILLVIVPRRLGDQAFGQLSFAVVYVSFFELLAQFGTGTFLVKTIARETSTLARYVVNSLVMKLALSFLLATIALVLAKVLGYHGELLLLIGAYCLSMILNTLNNVLTSSFMGLQRMGRPALLEIVRGFVGAALGLAVLLNGGSIVAYSLAFSLAATIPLVVNFLTLWPELRPCRTIDVHLWKRILVGGVPFFLWSAILAFYATIDIPLLRALSGDQTVGWYAVAYRWVSMPAFFAASVGAAFLPALSAHGVEISATFVRMANRALHLVAFVATPAAIGIALIASEFISVLYGGQFHESVPLMRLLALHVPIVGIDIILGSVLIASDKQRQWVLVGLAAAIFNPLANLVAIPLADRAFGNAAIGAATITVATELLMLVGAIFLRPTGVLDRRTVGLLGRIVVASLTMVPVVLLLQWAPLAIQVAAGAATYAAMSLALGTFTLVEVRRELAARRSAGKAQVTAVQDQMESSQIG